MDYTSFFATYGSSLLISSIVMVIFCVVSIIAMWLLFGKMGEKGWKAIIPFYNFYTLCKLVWSEYVFWEMFVAIILEMILLPFLVFYGAKIGVFGIVFNILIIICELIILANTIVLNLQIAYCFGQNAWFGVGLIFFDFIFLLILAFGDYKYIGNTSKKEI